MDQLGGEFCEVFGETLPRDIGSVLYYDRSY